jgi:hypothetical protein
MLFLLDGQAHCRLQALGHMLLQRMQVLRSCQVCHVLRIPNGLRAEAQVRL